MKVALFGIHKLLSDSLTVLEQHRVFPEVVIFPPFESVFHQVCEDICNRNNILILRPASVKDSLFINQLRRLSIDRIIVAGYHQIFPASLLELASLGALNCHGGLLPEEGGPNPWKWAVYADKSFSGITIHQMTDKVDQGIYFYKEKIALDKYETSEKLFFKISRAISRILPQFLQNVTLQEVSDDLNIASFEYKGKIPQELCQFDLSQTSEELERRVKSFSPRPGVIFDYDDQRILVKEVQILTEFNISGKWVFRSANGYIRITEFDLH